MSGISDVLYVMCVFQQVEDCIVFQALAFLCFGSSY